MPVVIEPWRHEYRDFAMTLGQAKPIYCDTMAIEIETVIFAVLARPKLRLTRDIARKQGIAFLTRIAIDSRSYRMLQNFLIFYSFSVFSFILFMIKEDSSTIFVFAYLIVHICKNILCRFHQRILKIEGVINVINSSKHLYVSIFSKLCLYGDNLYSFDGNFYSRWKMSPSYKLKDRCSIRCFGAYFFYSSHALLIIRPPADFTLPYSYTIIQPCIWSLILRMIHSIVIILCNRMITAKSCIKRGYL